jgi:hypothetical protein
MKESVGGKMDDVLAKSGWTVLFYAPTIIAAHIPPKDNQGVDFEIYARQLPFCRIKMCSLES